MELYVWQTCRYDPDTKVNSGPVSYHALFKSMCENETGINSKIINNYRISTEDKELFISNIVSKLQEALETGNNPLVDGYNIPYPDGYLGPEARGELIFQDIK